jgi:aminoglycoside 3-N-acetyltransferase
MYTDTALDLVKMLISMCGAHRTLAMPAFYFGDPAIGGANATFKQNPRFDMRRTPSQMGLATELFRRMPGVVQSRHPVYRVSALGPLAAALTAGHERAKTPAGLGTPFEFMAKHNTRIIGIGKPVQVLTQAHHTEDAMGDAFPVPRKPGEPLSMTLVDRAEEFPITLVGSGIQGRFNIWKLRTIMDRKSLQEWKFHHVPMFSTRAKDVSETLSTAARNGITLYDPL